MSARSCVSYPFCRTMAHTAARLGVQLEPHAAPVRSTELALAQSPGSAVPIQCRPGAAGAALGWSPGDEPGATPSLGLGEITVGCAGGDGARLAAAATSDVASCNALL